MYRYFVVFVSNICPVLLVSLLSTCAHDSPTPVEIRIFDFETDEQNNLTTDAEIILNIQNDEKCILKGSFSQT